MSMRRHFTLSGFAIFTLAAAFAPYAVAQQTGSINLAGSIGQNCTITVTATPEASSLDLTATSRVRVGDILQTCNKKSGYRITLGSDNCATGTAGAKLIGTVPTPENLRYSGEFANPTTGGSQASVTGLLSTACAGDTFVLGRAVTNAKINAETSNVYVNYTGDPALGADTYTDVLRITMVVN